MRENILEALVTCVFDQALLQQRFARLDRISHKEETFNFGESELFQ